MPKSSSSIVTESTRGVLAVALAAGLWAGAAAVASSLFDRGVEPLELVAARAVVATLGFALIPAAWSSRGRREQRRGRQKGAWVVALGLALALVNLAYYVAIERLAVAVAIVLQYSAPALVVLWTTFVSRRRPSGRVVIALVAAMAGVVLVSEVVGGDLGRFDALGVAMGLASAILFASYTLLSERVERDYGPLNAVFRAFATASLVWIVFLVPRGWPSSLFEGENVLPILFVGLAGTLAPFSLYVWGVSHIKSERASIAATLEPVLAALFAWLWLEESLSPAQIAGGALVLGAVVALQVRRNALTDTPAKRPPPARPDLPAARR